MFENSRLNYVNSLKIAYNKLYIFIARLTLNKYYYNYLKYHNETLHICFYYIIY